MPSPHDLTRHHALPRRYLGRDLLSGREGRGYTATDLFKFYALIASLMFALAYTYIKYLDLFAEAQAEDAGSGIRTLAVLTVIPLLLALVALEGFFWWAARALVDYTRWQRGSPRLWAIFWLVVLNFYFLVVLDPLDQVHRLMSRNGLAPAPNLILLFSGQVETFQFQWGYFLLWLLFWFLVVVAHASYFADGLREAWFYIKRINRYSASVLTGFRGTAAVALAPPVTRVYEGRPQQFDVPQLAGGRLTEAQAQAVVAADESGAITAAPGQRGVLLVDLGAFYWTPALDALHDEQGRPLLQRGSIEVDPAARRDELVVPIVGAKPASPEPGSGAISGAVRRLEAAATESNAGEAGFAPTDAGDSEASV